MAGISQTYDTGKRAQRRCESVALVAGFIILLTLALTVTLGSLGMLAGTGIGPITLPASFGLASLTAFAHSSPRCFAKSFILSLAVWGAAILIAWFTIDYTYDGLGYHHESIIALYEGVNFYVNPSAGDELSLWTRHYPKGMEMLQASVMALTHNLESGKAVNIALAASALLILWRVLGEIKILRISRRDRRKSRSFLSVKQKLIVELTVFCNPVALGQLHTSYVDFTIYFFIIITVCLTYLICRGSHSTLCIYALASVVILSTIVKYNALFFEGVTVALALLWIWRRRGLGQRSVKIIFFTSLISALAGILIVGWHPYVTNTYGFGHPLYPLMGEGAVDIMDKHTCAEYLAGNRFSTFFDSYFRCRPESLTMANDTRQGGFGPFSFIMFPVAAAAIVLYGLRFRRFDWICYMSVAVVLSCFFFEQSWWARYVPQLWLIVPLGYLCLCTFPNRIAVFGRCLLVTLSTILLVLGVWRCVIESTEGRAVRKVVSQTFAGEKVKVVDSRPYTRRILSDLGVESTPDDLAAPVPGDTVFRFYGYDDMIGIEMPVQRYDSLVMAIDREKASYGPLTKQGISAIRNKLKNR